MSLMQTSLGETLPIEGLSTGYKSGTLYAVGQDHTSKFWGVIQNDIIGTSEAQTTVDGRPILDNDVSQVGSGKGELAITGVHTVVIPSGLAKGSHGFKVGNPVYASGVNTRAGKLPIPNEVGSTDPTDYGFVMPLSTFTTYGTSGGLSLVGHVWKQAYLDLRTTSKTKGAWVAEVKLLGHPVAGLI